MLSECKWTWRIPRFTQLFQIFLKREEKNSMKKKQYKETQCQIQQEQSSAMRQTETNQTREMAREQNDAVQPGEQALVQAISSQLASGGDDAAEP